MNKKRILFIKTMNSTFIRQDEIILKKYFDIKSFLFKPGRFSRMLLSQIQLKMWLFRNIYKADLLYIWFADYHAILPVIFGKVFKKKTIVLLGGMDAVKIPEVNQGVYLRPFRGLCAKWSIRLCDFIISCDESLIETVNTYAKETPIKAGVRNLIKNFETPYTVIPFGFDPEKWNPGSVKREKMVLTVAIVQNMNKLKLKGFDLLIEVAKKLPGYKFMFIGAIDDGARFLNANKTENVVIKGLVDNSELVKYYQQAKVYAQLSWSEGLPNVLCEAMLCGCIPVGSNVNGIPYAIGNTGFIVKKNHIEEARDEIIKALESDDSKGEAARERMKKYFSLEQREQRLIETVNNLCDEISNERG